MASVWILTRGEYSDYGIVGAFATKDAAHETARRLSCFAEPDTEDDRVSSDCRYGDYHIERYDLGETAWEARYKGSITVRKGRVDGDVYVSSISAEDGDDPSKRGVELYWWMAFDNETSKAQQAAGRYGEPLPYAPAANVSAYAEDPERAKKVAAERAYRLAAEWEVEVEAARSRGELA